MIKRLLTALFLVLLLSTNAKAQNGNLHTSPVPPEPQQKQIKIVASFTILADMIKQIGGPYVDVVSLIGLKDHAHHFTPTPKDSALLAQADIIAINGLSFEGWMDRLINASGTKAKLLVATAGLPVIWKKEKGQETPDPHAWMSLRNAKLYIKNISNALSEARPELKKEFLERSRSYLKTITALHKAADLKFKLLSSTKRKLITNHNAFGYFARDYNIEVKSLSGLDDHDKPSPKEIANIIHFIQTEKVKTIFIEHNHDNRLIKQIANDANVKIGKPLFTGTLTDKNGAAPTYLQMMHANISRILDGVE